VASVEEKKKKVTTVIDAPPSSLMDSPVNPKVKRTEGNEIAARSLVHSTLGVKWHVGTLRWGLEKLTNKSITHTDLHKPNHKLVRNWNTFGAQVNHKQTMTHKTHHGPNLTKATTFPLIVFFVFGHEAST